jgi:hypothetical protein
LLRRFRHSATYTNARIGATNTIPGSDGSGFFYSVDFWLRADSTFTNGYQATIGLDGFSISKVVSGAMTLLASTNASVQEGLRSGFSAAGSTLRVSYGGIQYLEVVDTTFSAAGFACVVLNDDGTNGTAIGPLTIETPYSDVAFNLSGKNVTTGLVSTVGIGYLGAADIALISQQVLATLQANQIPVNVKQMNDASVIGTGTTGDAWRGVGVLP